ncbi:auxin-responsive protein SAUR50 [Phoenix dactylifera]|uniref:Auxin-responsive protein SAUR50 n=1 Tax=Phoenix dactylifera TaxID=42345 RepID=A0A8B8J557_PHODC|nr:auxin-responsive protein SAUR50 [Phoenix dactylifera]
MPRGSFLRAFLRKWKEKGNEFLIGATSEPSQCSLLTCSQEEQTIPKDVPRGHLVVYVGEECKRFVIKITFLEHPLFQALLDQAREEYEFKPGSKLCIPCNENIFLGILHDVRSQQDQRFWLCC